MIGKKYYSDNDFTIEFWFYPQISSSSKTALVADHTAEVGVFYQNGNVVFDLDSETLEYTLPYNDRVFHIAAVYSVTSASIYINGNLAITKTLENFAFTNQNLILASGPTSNTDSFLINSVAIYRYGLSSTQIQNHYFEGLALNPIQIVDPDNGELFDIYDDDLSTVFKYSYPGSRPLQDLYADGIEYDTGLECLQIIQTEDVVPSTVVIEDTILFPSTLDYDSSKIEWDGNSGVAVSVSTDGITYNNCINGQQMPGFNSSSFSYNGLIYLRITFTSSDTSKYIPRLFNLSISLYNNQKRYSYNGNSYIKSLEEYGGISNLEITMGKSNYEILSRNSRNGIRTVNGSGFEISTSKSLRTIEFFYTPSSLGTSGLISTISGGGYAASNFSWNGSGVISKTNISAIYVNGVNKSSQTSISNVFKQNQLHHVIIVFTSAVSGNIRFNYSSSGAISSLYQNIGIYEDAFNSTKANNHYNLYVEGQYVTISDNSGIAMTENSVDGYDFDWIVVETK